MLVCTLLVVGVEAVWRNPRLGRFVAFAAISVFDMFVSTHRRGVVAYLEQTYGEHYKVINVCAEKNYIYDKSVFKGKLLSSA